MAVITIGHQKGGPGKTTTAINLSALIKQQGYNVILVDADQQRNAASWAEAREENHKRASIPCVEKRGNLRECLIELNKHYDFVVVDVPGRDSREMRTALFASHVFLAPYRPSQFDTETVLKVNEIYQDAKDNNPNLVSCAFLTQVPTNAGNTEANEALEILNEYSSIPMLKTRVHNRTAYRRSVSDGSGVIDGRDYKAKREMQSLLFETIQNLEKVIN